MRCRSTKKVKVIFEQILKEHKMTRMSCLYLRGSYLNPTTVTSDAKLTLAL